MVVAIHAEFYHNILYPWLGLAVPMFFVISSFLLFERINDAKKTDIIVKSYILRLAKLYFFWFVVLLPFTIAKRIAWFKSGLAFGIIKTLLNILFSSTFPASWFIIATIEGTLVIYLLRKENNRLLFVIFLFIYLYISIFEPTNIGQFIDLRHTFLRSSLYILIGKMYADGEFNMISTKKVCLILSIILSITLYILYRINTINEMRDYYSAIIPFALIAYFGLLKNVNTKVKNSIQLRNFSSFIYPIHILLCAIVRAILSRFIKDITLKNTLVYFLVILIAIIMFRVIKILEHKFKILKYSY